ncbi:MAG TPA: acyl-CoA thioesterase [Candidatus Aphodoplasma excrementigallinarum]|uniref:Acyl-CoA thioesterase n=1 Tax=Candidatus Aphodoplasma excrementigallinarum TaxID=2840673 RepID=A0A9D1NGB4_9FIRM|nr:acyl-CoA thioesterase [Candidatus Aphodoplasma excrementigallinarum]
MERKTRTVADSRVEQIQIVMPEHINGYGRLFGGQLVAWIDIVAGVVARRHCHNEITTVCIDNLNFKAPAYANETVILIGRLSYVGTTSMEVRVDTYVEALDSTRTLVNTAYLVMVALDGKERPMPVPGLTLVSDEERAEWEAGKRRSELRKQRRLEQY